MKKSFSHFRFSGVFLLTHFVVCLPSMLHVYLNRCLTLSVMLNKLRNFFTGQFLICFDEQKRRFLATSISKTNFSQVFVGWYYEVATKQLR